MLHSDHFLSLQPCTARDQTSGQCKVTVWAEEDSSRVVAFYSIAPHVDAREHVGKRYSSGYSTIPGYLLGRMALDTTLQGLGLGSELLHEVFVAVHEASLISGGRVLYVDPLDDAARTFYLHHDFTETINPGRLWIRISDIEVS